MTLDDNINQLKRLLLARGWFLVEEDSSFEYYYNTLNLKLSFPKERDNSDYPRILKSLLLKIRKLNPDISRRPFFQEINAQCINLKQRYSKNKEEWILLQPNSKYHFSELPDIYIPI